MKKSSLHYYIRIGHRWLGLVIGIQFLAWTIGGLYFSWSDMNEVHGDYEHLRSPLIDSKSFLISPAIILDSLNNIEEVDSIADINLISILNKLHWSISYISKGRDIHSKRYMLGDATTGKIRNPLSKDEVIKIACDSYIGNEKLTNIEYLTIANGHHEYRNQPLPAYAITFGTKRPVTFYIPTEMGVIQKVRNNVWRRFDFLWMMHTMDYRGRDNITNWILRFFSIMGIITILSGFILFFISRKSKYSP